MSRVRVTHTFNLKDENGKDATREHIEYVVATMTVQVDEPVVRAYAEHLEDPFNDIEGSIEGRIKVDTIVLDDVRDPVYVALEQFWSTIADLHPHITTGDLDPGTRARFDQAAADAVRTWKRYNNPQPNTYAVTNPYPADPE